MNAAAEITDAEIVHPAPFGDPLFRAICSKTLQIAPIAGDGVRGIPFFDPEAIIYETVDLFG